METSFQDQVQDRLQRISQNIENVTQLVGARKIRIVGVSTSWMVDPVIEAGRAGVREFCEDYLPEGISKKAPVDRKVSHLTWHFTGTLDSKKLNLAFEFFDWIHSIDRLTYRKPILEASKRYEERRVHFLLDINPLGGLKRFGMTLDDARLFLDRFLCDDSNSLFQGLSFRAEPQLKTSDVLRAFDGMESIYRKLSQDYGVSSWHLAMGDSSNYERAIQKGATIVRLGRAIFGPQSLEKEVGG